ncbi:MAG: sporulation protein YqfD [Oscillospiraceae bacterium]|jgi:similar to stage IV sporulation protein
MPRWNSGVLFEAEGPEPEQLLSLCAEQGVRLREACRSGDFSITFVVPHRAVSTVETLAARCGCSLRQVEARGVLPAVRRMRRRGVLLVGIVVCAALLLWSSFHVWEIRVTGNETVSTGEILRALDDCGVSVGSRWMEYSSDLIRSQVLLEIPELSWLTVNVSGSCAEVVVRERKEKPELADEKTPTNVVAEKDGVITEVRVYNGASRVSVGQTVMQGDVLVSGAMESIAGGVRLVHANADVTARTWYELTAECPVEQTEKQYTGEKRTQYALILGTHRINFYRNSGNSDRSCDKLTIETRLAVDGVFTLPLSLIREVYTEYETVSGGPDADSIRQSLEETLLQQLEQQIGENAVVHSTEYETVERGNMITMTLRAECTEQISTAVEMTDGEIRTARAVREEVET